MFNVAIMGYGTIGSGVAEILEKNREKAAAAAGEEIALKYVLDVRDFPGSPVEEKLIHNFDIIRDDADVQVVVETMGGLTPSYPFVKACLLAGKHVVTSNKALVAAHGTELLAIAREKSVNFLFEASVGGGIPIIRSLNHSMCAENIYEIAGILNGTTNYILTRMCESGGSFEEALKEAQALGYAERDPSADVEGVDTCRKIAILTALATGREVNYEDIYTEGITKVSTVDFDYAKALGASIKLFGMSRMNGGHTEAWVAPVMIGSDHELCAVNDVYNGILVRSDMLGKTMLLGSGAGKLPTGSAVVADIIEAVQNSDRNIPYGWGSERGEIAPFSESEHRYFVRINGDVNEKLSKVQEALGKVTPVVLNGAGEFGVLTEKMTEAEYRAKAAALPVAGMIRAEW